MVPFDDVTLANGQAQLLVDGYVRFTRPRSGIYGRVVSAPVGFIVPRFVAFVMSDGCDFDFTSRVALIWRVMLGDGELDYDAEWFPILKGTEVYFGYGTIGTDESAIERCQATVHQEWLERPGERTIGSR